jgi:DNA-binding PadR family transcriptional regulator
VASIWDEEKTQGPPRRIYRITKHGNEVLELWVKELERSKVRIERLLDSYHGHMKECKGDHD